MTRQDVGEPRLPARAAGLEKSQHLGRKSQGNLLLGPIADRRPTALGQRAGSLPDDLATDRDLRARRQLRRQLGRVIVTVPIGRDRFAVLGHWSFASI